MLFPSVLRIKHSPKTIQAKIELDTFHKSNSFQFELFHH